MTLQTRHNWLTWVAFEAPEKYCDKTIEVIGWTVLSGAERGYLFRGFAVIL